MISLHRHTRTVSSLQQAQVFFPAEMLVALVERGSDQQSGLRAGYDTVVEDRLGSRAQAKKLAGIRRAPNSWPGCIPASCASGHVPPAHSWPGIPSRGLRDNQLAGILPFKCQSRLDARDCHTQVTAFFVTSLLFDLVLFSLLFHKQRLRSRGPRRPGQLQ